MSRTSHLYFCSMLNCVGFQSPFVLLSWCAVPPDDEGWLCPGCDCKLDCVGMLNDFQESTLSVTDNWEVWSSILELIFGFLLSCSKCFL